MSKATVTPTRKVFTLHPHLAEGSWFTNNRRHFDDALQLLDELEAVVQQLIQRWPVPPDQGVRNAEKEHPDLWALVCKRDLLSDSVRIFAAMAVEGFVNYYG